MPCLGQGKLESAECRDLLKVTWPGSGDASLSSPVCLKCASQQWSSHPRAVLRGSLEMSKKAVVLG